MFLYSLNPKLRTSGRKPALPPEKRRQSELIEFDYANEKGRKEKREGGKEKGGWDFVH